MRQRYYCTYCRTKHTSTKKRYITAAQLHETGRFWAHLPYALQGAANPRLHNALYESFHGNPPSRTRRVKVSKPEGPLVAIGRAVKIEYEPYGSSRHVGTRFYHILGDTGSQKLKSNTILCTDKKGKNLFLIKDNAAVKRPYFSNLGIIG